MPKSVQTANEEAIDRRVKQIAHEANRAVVHGYIRRRRLNGIKASTLANDARVLSGFCASLDEKPVEDADRDDVLDYLEGAAAGYVWTQRKSNGKGKLKRKRGKLAPSTLGLHKMILSHFFKDLRGTDEYPPEVRDLKRSIGRTIDRIPTDQLITAAEMEKLYRTNPDPRDQAVLAVLYEGGFRASELCALNVGSVAFEEWGVMLTLPKNTPGLKTGARQVALIDAADAVHKWYEAHPDRDDPKAPLFFSKGVPKKRPRMTANTLYVFCRRAGRKAGLRNDIHPHLFRHTAATEKVKEGWTEAEMRAYFGWTRGSEMPANYTHLAGKDYVDLLLERRGLKGKSESKKRALASRTCPVCEWKNPGTNNFCGKCRNPISPEARDRARAEAKQRQEETLAEILAERHKETLEVARQEVQRLLSSAQD